MIKPQIILERFPSKKDWTLSEFFIDGIKKGVGVEDEKRDVKVFGETRIDNGIYEMELVNSPKFSGSYFVDSNGYLSNVKDARFTKPHQLIHVKNVKNFENILWHWGNTDLDTHGCYIVGSRFGTSKGREGVFESRIKYLEIYPLIHKIIYNNKLKGLKTYVEYKDKK